MLRVSTPPNCAMPAVIAPLTVVLDGYKKPDIEPAYRKRSGWNSASVIAAVPTWAAPTILP
jgi:hypothetical protein